MASFERVCVCECVEESSQQRNTGPKLFCSDLCGSAMSVRSFFFARKTDATRQKSKRDKNDLNNDDIKASRTSLDGAEPG